MSTKKSVKREKKTLKFASPPSTPTKDFSPPSADGFVGATPPKRFMPSPGASPLSPKSPSSGEPRDFLGFVTGIWNNESKSGNVYMDIKLKTAKDEFNTIRFMKAQNPNVKEEYLKSLQAGSIPIKMCKVYVSASGTAFFNSFRGSRIEEGAILPFKVADHTLLSIAELKTKLSGTFSVIGCLKWLGEEKTYENKFGISKRLRECILYDGCDDIVLTVWEKLLDEKLIEVSQWYTFSCVNIKNYFGIKLTTTALTQVTRAENQPVDWEQVDVNLYRQKFKEVHDITHPTLICPEINNVVLDIFKACSNKSCREKVTVVPGNKVVRCNKCCRYMKPSTCNQSFEALLEFDSVSLSLPIEVLNEFLGEDVMKTYGNDSDALIELILYLENIDFDYNTRNVITKMYKHIDDSG